MGFYTPALRATSEFLGLTRKTGQPYSWRTLRHRSFRRYFLGSVISDFGTWLQNTAQVLLAYHLAHSALAVGLVTCAQFTSPLVLGPFAGVLADRIGGRRTLLLSQVVAAVIAAALAAAEFCHVLTEWPLVCGALLGGLTFTFALPARNVTVRRLVPTADTRPAFVMDAVSYNLGRALAPPLTVFIVLTLHWYGLVFAANGVTFLVFTLMLVLAGKGADAEPERRSRVKDGFVIARRNRRIMLLLLMVAAVTVADDPVQVLGPALANHLGVSQGWSGWFISALGAGSVVGSLRRPKHLPRLRLAATALAALGVCMVAFVSTPWVWVSLGAALAAGVSCLLANSMTRTLLSQTAGVKPGQRYGRVGDRLGRKQTPGIDHRRAVGRMDRGMADGDDPRDPRVHTDRRAGGPSAQIEATTPFFANRSHAYLESAAGRSVARQRVARARPASSYAARRAGRPA